MLAPLVLFLCAEIRVNEQEENEEEGKSQDKTASVWLDDPPSHCLTDSLTD